MLSTYSLSPMQARPDTPAVLAVEDRGMPAVLAACGDPDVVLVTLTQGQWPASRDFALGGSFLNHTTIQN